MEILRIPLRAQRLCVRSSCFFCRRADGANDYQRPSSLRTPPCRTALLQSPSCARPSFLLFTRSVGRVSFTGRELSESYVPRTWPKLRDCSDAVAGSRDPHPALSWRERGSFRNARLLLRILAAGFKTPLFLAHASLPPAFPASAFLPTAVISNRTRPCACLLANGPPAIALLPQAAISFPLVHRFLAPVEYGRGGERRDKSNR